MKCFQDFLAQMTPEAYESIKLEVLSNRTPTSLTDSIPDISFRIALKLLERYHEWLQD